MRVNFGSVTPLDFERVLRALRVGNQQAIDKLELVRFCDRDFYNIIAALHRVDHLLLGALQLIAGRTQYDRKAG